jgi:serine/threonine-protein kinase
MNELGALAQPGTVLLGKYQIERVIGIGGMGAVVAAHHLQLDEHVAIKFLLPSMLSSEEVVQRFLREARAAIKIRSEHCVRVHDVGTLENGAPYMVMEFLQGQDLEGMIAQRGAMPIPETIDLVLQAGEALAEAHAIGIVHRDLKPANLFVTRRADGTPSLKVLDFGISKKTEAAGAAASVTKTQAVLGSPRYMSPEQMKSTKDVDARADIWALGTVLYEALSGKPTFDAETMTALCAQILQEPARPLAPVRHDLPPALDAAILVSLEKERDRRYPTMAHFAAAIAPFGTHAATASAERIARVLGVAPGAMAAPRPPSPSMPGPMPQQAAFGATTDARSPMTTSSPAVTKSGSGLAIVGVVLGILGVIVVIVGIVFLVRRGGSPSAAGPVPSASAAAMTATPTTTTTATPNPTANAATTATPNDTASAPASALAATAGSARAGATSTARGATVPTRPSATSTASQKPPTPPKPPDSDPFGNDRKG